MTLLLGYGHSTPKTMWGRLFTMVYALFGIPLGLVLFNSIGKHLFETYYICSYFVECCRRKIEQIFLDDYRQD